MKDERTERRAGTTACQWFWRVLALVFVFSTAGAMVVRSRGEIATYFEFAPLTIVPAEHQAQVNVVKAAVPRGARILYVMQVYEAWQIGLWQRSMFPDYSVTWCVGPAEVKAIRENGARQGDPIKYAIVTDDLKEDLGFARQVALAPYPNSVPIHLGIW